MPSQRPGEGKEAAVWQNCGRDWIECLSLGSCVVCVVQGKKNEERNAGQEKASDIFPC